MPTEADDRAELVELIHRNLIAIWTQDYAAYEGCFVHSSYATRFSASRQTGIVVRQGWDDIAARMHRVFSDPSLASRANAYDATIENLQLRIVGDMAWRHTTRIIRWCSKSTISTLRA